MKILKTEYIDGMQGESILSLNRNELCQICNGMYRLEQGGDKHLDKDLYSQLRVARDILDYGAVDQFTFEQATIKESENE